MTNVIIDDYTGRAENSTKQPIPIENIEVEARPKSSGSLPEDFSPWLVSRDKTIDNQPPETTNKSTDEPAWGSCPRRVRNPRTAREIVEEMKRNRKGV
jgi:hypothetical protein